MISLWGVCTLGAAQHIEDENILVDELPSKFDAGRDALVDLKIAQTLASSGHKRILVDLGGEWCENCLQLDKFFDANPDLREKRDE